MLDLLLLFGLVAALVAILTNIGIWSHHRLAVKVAALAIAALALPTGYFSLVTLLSRPKPIALEWTPPKADETTVIAAQMKEDVAIYLWVQRPDSEEPRSYVLPWDEQVARQLHEAQRAAEAEGGTVQVRLSPQQKDIEQADRMFYAAPPPAPPPKVTGHTAPGAAPSDLASANPRKSRSE
ncbi:MAG: hypothetical protein ACFCUQ_06750 [Kiloniellales bacterium]